MSKFKIFIILCSLIYSGTSFADTFSGGLYPEQIICVNTSSCDTIEINHSILPLQILGQVTNSEAVPIFDKNLYPDKSNLPTTILPKKVFIDDKRIFAMSLDPKNGIFKDFTSKLMVLAYVLYDKSFSPVFGKTQYTYDRSTTALNIFENANLSKISFASLSNGWTDISTLYSNIKNTFSQYDDGNVLKVGKRVFGVEKKIGLY